eukprot:SAG31_NODE_6102_length_2171_cov_1.590251_1_plen_242_part_10
MFCSSYQWDHQDKVQRARRSLAKHGVKTWMDVDGGMQRDLFESMAEGVEGAACVVAFLTQQYQDSTNCKLELKFARQSGITILPVMLQGGGWRPTGWLGIVVAGAIWQTLEDHDFEQGITGLVAQIKSTVPMEDIEQRDGDESTNISRDELRAELARLRADLSGTGKGAPTVQPGGAVFDPSQPAVLPSIVPELPPDYKETDTVKALIPILLQTKSNSEFKSRVGFYGTAVHSRCLLFRWYH